MFAGNRCDGLRYGQYSSRAYEVMPMGSYAAQTAHILQPERKLEIKPSTSYPESTHPNPAAANRHLTSFNAKLRT